MAKTVLIIDDEEMNRNLAKLILETDGYEVIVAEGAREGIVAVSKMSDVPDVVLMDLMMPEIDGFEGIKMFKALPKMRSTPIMALTALNDKESVLKAIQAGADDYLAKPFDISDLTQKVKCLMKIRDFVKRWCVVI